MPTEIERELADRVRSLAVVLKDSHGRLERDLAARLLAIADAPEPERPARVRASLSLADRNLFQATVNGYQAMADGSRDHPNPTVRALAVEFEEDVAKAKKAQGIIEALLAST